MERSAAAPELGLIEPKSGLSAFPSNLRKTSLAPSRSFSPELGGSSVVAVCQRLASSGALASVLRAAATKSGCSSTHHTWPQSGSSPRPNVPGIRGDISHEFAARSRLALTRRGTPRHPAPQQVARALPHRDAALHNWGGAIGSFPARLPRDAAAARLLSIFRILENPLSFRFGA